MKKCENYMHGGKNKNAHTPNNQVEFGKDIYIKINKKNYKVLYTFIIKVFCKLGLRYFLTL